MESRDAASMLCGGLTVYSPLVRNGCGPGTKVGVVGIGGLVSRVPLVALSPSLIYWRQGHYAVLFAKALGAEVYAFSHGTSKEADARKMGADHFVVTNPGFHEDHQLELDIIISTRDAAEGFPLAEYLSCVIVCLEISVAHCSCTARSRSTGSSSALDSQTHRYRRSRGSRFSTTVASSEDPT